MIHFINGGYMTEPTLFLGDCLFLMKDMADPLLYTLIIGFIYPDGTAISKIKICWKTNLQSYSNFFDRFIKEDNNG